jgi:hypothetical protein
MKNKTQLLRRINLTFVLTLLLSISLSSSLKKTKSKLKASEETTFEKIELTNFEYDLFYVDSECNDQNCPSERGYCQTANRCVCKLGYANLVQNINYYCDYNQKSQKISFLLEFFLPFGTGHIYSGRLILGFAKLLIISGTIFLDILVKRMDSSKSKHKNNLIMFVYSLYLFILFWQIFDITMIGLNKYPDGNGIPLFVS